MPSKHPPINWSRGTDNDPVARFMIYCDGKPVAIMLHGDETAERITIEQATNLANTIVAALQRLEQRRLPR